MNQHVLVLYDVPSLLLMYWLKTRAIYCSLAFGLAVQSELRRMVRGSSLVCNCLLAVGSQMALLLLQLREVLFLSTESESRSCRGWRLEVGGGGGVWGVGGSHVILLLLYPVTQSNSQSHPRSKEVGKKMPPT